MRALDFYFVTSWMVVYEHCVVAAKIKRKSSQKYSIMEKTVHAEKVINFVLGNRIREAIQ